MFFRVKLFPKSKKQKILKISEDRFEVFVKSKAEQNKANQEMIILLSSFFDISEKDIRIISGHHRQNKMLKITK